MESHFEFCVLQASKFVISEIHAILPRFLKESDADQLVSKCYSRVTLCLKNLCRPTVTTRAG